ncbi:HD domain-containing phosphohydrolase [Bacteriovorax sp. PP10]|uniref:HD domain-containing phosphohydrolase n=1 Tax=Bacteriovorax antarcticus TaxID=3088717 RepID=A0ABU5VY74_9BACT|nr:HD domain-containing phosphohydrolase [Bacteriovorax sp. PP10]MEA9358016.1 HD domain-containing phosphohydrolase [Bacteriovorax sp. PP10]
MKTEYDFFIIDKEHLKAKKTFPFQLYIFNPAHKKYSMFLNGNRPLTKEHNDFLDYILERGGKLAVLKNQRKTFLVAQETDASEIPSLKERELHPLEKERIMNMKLKEMYEEKRGAFSLQTEFELACQTDNFEAIIENARVEILTFSVTMSPTVSLALHLAKTHLEKDTYINRIVAVSYLLAKNCNIVDQDALADIICGAYFAHLGLTQTPLTIARTPYNTLPEKERTLFQKHTILGHHLIKKSQINLSERCKKVILDHHERASGNGYPSMKYGDQIETLSQIVGAVSHLFEYSSGKITGGKQSMKAIILAMKSKSFLPGLEFDFGEKVFQSIITLINTDKIETKEDNKESKKAA